MRTFVITLGFHEDHAIRVLTSHAATDTDSVVVLTSKPVVPAVRRAFDGLRSYTLRVGIGEPKLIEVPPDPNEGIKEIIKVIRDAQNIILDLSGGMRHLIVFTLLALMLSGKEATILLYPEGGTEPEIIVPKDVIRVIQKPPTDSELRVIKEVGANPGITDEELAVLLNRKVKTIKNIVSELSKKGLILRKGRRGGLYLSKWGEVVKDIMT